MAGFYPTDECHWREPIMKHGPFLVLGLFFVLALSWLGMIATPDFQLGNAQPTNVPPANLIYPTPYSGLANQGREVYRANGCAYCHTQVVRQDGIKLQVVITSPGTNQAAVVQAAQQLRPGLSPTDAQQLLTSKPAIVLTTTDKSDAEAAQKALSAAGADAAVRVLPTGPDIERGWGTRLTVAHDYLYDTPLLLGSARLGPDLTNIGVRRPDRTWQLLHLYDAKLEVPDSVMPRFPFLFTTLSPSARRPSNALLLPDGKQIVPSPDAEALVAYLLNLRADMPLFEAPGPPVISATPSGETNQPAELNGGTNTSPGTAPMTNQAGPK
jgi:cbb3-type cytochrome oxidase cytochrome c subunit